MSTQKNDNPFHAPDDHLTWENTLIREAEDLQVQPAPGSWMQIQNLLSLKTSIADKPIFRLVHWKLTAVAASVLLVISVLWLVKSKEGVYHTTEAITQDIMPYYASYLVVAQNIDGYLPVEEGLASSRFKEQLSTAQSSDDSI